MERLGNDYHLQQEFPEETATPSSVRKEVGADAI
tara:strand:- start:2442 stop:2543 length:102 start_codon:yes stop_codon:yes gene_type:complete